MEYVEGDTLAQILAKIEEAKPQTETSFGPKDDADYFVKLARAFGDVADGLQHAHSKGVVHRDIKPSNLILDGEGRLRILDFGLARLEGQASLTLSGDFVGTPLYMSPEQARRQKIAVDHRTDIYSLGATMYEMLAFRPPFRGRDHQETLSQIIARDPEEPTTFNPRIPRDLETIVLEAIAPDAALRYPTAEAPAADLRAYLDERPISARTPSLMYLLRVAVRRPVSSVVGRSAHTRRHPCGRPCRSGPSELSNHPSRNHRRRRPSRRRPRRRHHRRRRDLASPGPRGCRSAPVSAPRP